jgi:putative hydrolase of the HAD superfamily
MKLTTLFFDLDDTLYPSTSGLWQAIRDRIGLYMYERVHLDWPVIPELRAHLFKTYGTTMRGLLAEYGIDRDDYLQFVHDVPLADYIQPDRQLREILCSYPQEKWIFTNSDSGHAQRVLHTLELDGIFKGIIDVREIAPYCKPMREAFEIALKKAGQTEPQNCAFIDDTIANIQTAYEMGFFTVRVGAQENGLACHATVTRCADLQTALPANGHT